MIDDFDKAMDAGANLPPSRATQTPFIEDDVEIVQNLETPAGDIIDEKAQPEQKAPIVEKQEETPEEMVQSIRDGVRPKASGNLNLTPLAQVTKEKLDKEKKVMMMIPLGIGEKNGTRKIANINGYRFEIMKNTPVMLPISVAKLLMKSMKMSADAKTSHPLNVNNIDDDVARRSALNV